MRIIAGAFKGKKLKSLEGLDTRPTTDKVKEAIFNAIQFQIYGSCFLDLFAGSGQMGIEALSRGAKKAVFVEKNKRAVAIINSNLEGVKSLGDAKVINLQAEMFLSTTSEKFDIAFLDPPYKTGVLTEFIPRFNTVMNKNSILICEHASKEILPDQVMSFIKVKTYKYGKIAVSILKREDS